MITCIITYISKVVCVLKDVREMVSPFKISLSLSSFSLYNVTFHLKAIIEQYYSGLPFPNSLY